MQFFNKLTIAKKIYLSFYLSFAVMVLLIAQPFSLINDIDATYKQQITTYKQIQIYIHIINDNLRKIGSYGVENALTEDDAKAIKMIKNSYDIVQNTFKQLHKELSIYKSEEIHTLLNNIQNRMVGYRSIALSVKDEMKEDQEDGIYAILALSQARDKISYELNKLLKKIQQAYQKQTQVMQEQMKSTLYWKIALTFVMLIFIFALNKFVARNILGELQKLYMLVEGFFDFLNKRTRSVTHMTIDSDDEIAHVAKLIDKNISVAEDLIKEERDRTREIEIQVDLATKEIQKLNKELHSTQKEIIHVMGTIAEEHSKETGLHIIRVANYSFLLAKLSGMDLKEAMLLRDVSPMHDIGKLGIPDAILNKPGRFTDEEFEKMKEHAEIGYNMLKHSKRELLQAAAIVAHEHHERWDGKGYPRGLKGEQIHIYGRITAIADVFDALASDRVYKKAWPLEKILKMFEEEKGKQFDPRLMKIFLDNIDKFLESKRVLEMRDRSKNNKTILS